MSTQVTKQNPAPGNLNPAPQARWRVASLLRVISLVIILGCALGAWRLFLYRSPVDKGLQALQTAYLGERPLEARFGSFAYAPFASTRGAAPSDDKAHALAAQLLLEAAIDNPSAQSHHALGQLYLSERKFDKAIGQFEEALEADQQNARAHSDLGAALFEKGRDGASDEDGLNVEAFARSLSHLNRALALAPDLGEALFNRALLHQQMMLKESAAEDWRAYIEKDPSSRWADEARHNLSRLEEGQRRVEQSQQNLVEDFLNAYRARETEKAWALFSQNREKLTTELVTAYLKSDAQTTADSKREALDALDYAGELDVQRAGDRYAADLAYFYRAASPEKLETARKARELVRQAREFYDVSKLEEAVTAYSTARRDFIQIGDLCGGQQAAFWLGLCYWEMTQTNQSWVIWKALMEDCRTSEHRWLQARTLNMLSGVAFKGDEYSQAIAYSNEARNLAGQINDVACAFSAESALIEYYRLLGNQPMCMTQVGRGLPLLDNAAIGIIPLWRYYSIVAMAHQTFGLYDASIDYDSEALRLAVAADDYVRLAISHSNIVVTYGKQQNFDAAFMHAGQAYEIAAAHASEATGQLYMALATVQTGHLYRERGEYAKALDQYDRAVELHRANNLDFSVHLYQAYRGRLICYLALKETTAAQQQLVTLLNVMDKHRATITEEENRNNFFAVEQSVYDLGIDLHYSQLHNQQQAFEYAEASRSRSLLDSMSAGAQVIKRDGKLDLLLRAGAQPLPLAEIQARIPNKARLLYYAVLDNKLLIWVISSTEVQTAEVDVSQASLTDAVTQYSSALIGTSDRDGESAARLARELYGYLIAPAEPLLGGSRALYIVPDKILNRLPWDALVSPTSGKFVVQDYLITLAPSATLYAICTDLAARKAGARDERVLSVGDPRFDRNLFPKLDPLSAAAAEAEKVANFYPSKSLLLGPAAREQAIRNEMAKAEVTHFALHCVVNDRSAMRSSLVLAKEPSGTGTQSPDGLLQAYEIYDIKLPRTRLAVLSACRTGVERYYSGEGMIGMARAFLVAQVPMVVASLWPVDSAATAELMIRFHEYRKREGLPTNEALRRAKIDLLQDPVARYRQPAYWAAFQTIGGQASF